MLWADRSQPSSRSRPGAYTYLEEDVHVLPGGVLPEHGVRVFPHHVVDGLDDVHHLLHRDTEAQGGNPEVKLFLGDGLGLPIPLRNESEYKDLL